MKSSSSLIIVGIILLVVLVAISILIPLVLPIFDNTVYEPTASFEVFLCPPLNCSVILSDSIANAKTLDCALYDLDDEHVVNEIKSNARIVLDEDAPHVSSDANFVREKGSGLMHNKFCIVNSSLLLTGTYNPTESANFNYNLIMKSDSPSLIASFQREFDELYSREFHGGMTEPYLLVVTRDANISVGFCPEDYCEETLVAEIDAAKKEIYFMAFTLTSNEVVNALIRAHTRGVFVKGIAEPAQYGRREALPALEEAGIPIAYASNKGKFHHKAFIIDGLTTVTGSYNPTKSANEKNDEALLVIDSRPISEQMISFYKTVPTLPSE